MPIAIPPPDIDPTVVPQVSTELTEAETWETGVATDAPMQAAEKPQPCDSAAGLLKTWIDPKLR
ncbi:hypothetical protein J7E62_05530 [Variovorax paradoxus]|nr:hypothetical protein [Variovorax paradoxus]